MKSWLKAALVAAAVTGGAQSASAATDFVLEANAARAHGRWGGEFGAGLKLGLGPLSITPAGGVFVYQGDNDRYYFDDFGNGQTRCRDSSNGQFARDELCDNSKLKR